MEPMIAERGAHGMGGINPDESQLRSLLQADYGGPASTTTCARC